MGLILVHTIGGRRKKKTTITVEDYLYEFYRKVGENAGGLKPEKVMADALFKLAGELSLNAIDKKNENLLRKVKDKS